MEEENSPDADDSAGGEGTESEDTKSDAPIVLTPKEEEPELKRVTPRPYFHIKDDDPDLGKGFHASRDIKAGTIILDEEPVLTATTWITPTYLPFPSCISCGLLMYVEFENQCSKCHWPCCSDYCEKLAIHADNECEIFASQNITYPPSEDEIRPSDLRHVIMLLRAGLLKRKNPEIFENILKLQSDFSIGRNNDYSWNIEIQQFKLFLKGDSLGMGDEEMKKLLKIFQINGYSSSEDDEEVDRDIFCSLSLGYLYLQASRLNHSCVPNCNWIVSKKPDFKIRIRTAVSIKKGQPLTIDYYMKESMVGTKQRLVHFRKAGFLCSCSRCRDPTEVGTFMSAIVCSYCRTKVEFYCMLPDNPLDIKDSAVWRCTYCLSPRYASEILPSIEKIAKLIERKQDELMDSSEDDSLLRFCRSIVGKHSCKTLHPYHWVIQAATRASFKYLTKHWRSNMDLETSQFYVNCGVYLLSIHDRISPGLSFHRANLHRQVAKALQDQVTQLCSMEKFEQAVKNLERSLKLQSQALKYYQTEFPDRNGILKQADLLKRDIELAKEKKNVVVLQLMAGIKSSPEDANPENDQNIGDGHSKHFKLLQRLFTCKVYPDEEK